MTTFRSELVNIMDKQNQSPPHPQLNQNSPRPQLNQNPSRPQLNQNPPRPQLNQNPPEENPLELRQPNYYRPYDY